jgi:hypothetical protein
MINRIKPFEAFEFRRNYDLKIRFTAGTGTTGKTKYAVNIAN